MAGPVQDNFLQNFSESRLSFGSFLQDDVAVFVEGNGPKLSHALGGKDENTK